GRTLAQHDLRIIDVLLKSTACLIANKESLDSPGTKEKIERVVEALGGGLS
ncbi:MAG: ATP phosphoribosyltransferase, partial [Dehalococcoidia bacterium]|nr:ATP phosphoribosyltransferase [Dehalococcoidia bacterium]